MSAYDPKRTSASPLTPVPELTRAVSNVLI